MNALMLSCGLVFDMEAPAIWGAKVRIPDSGDHEILEECLLMDDEVKAGLKDELPCRLARLLFAGEALEAFVKAVRKGKITPAAWQWSLGRAELGRSPVASTKEQFGPTTVKGVEFRFAHYYSSLNTLLVTAIVANVED